MALPLHPSPSHPLQFSLRPPLPLPLLLPLSLLPLSLAQPGVRSSSRCSPLSPSSSERESA